ncbi:S-adenosyl-L-methionine-dependent methyltransferase [Phlyctochytrium arcticum]|nr:S-adenosyl-L-methionine-dependent methyltransferase [Phlyctochytrium arcticum]
MPDQQATSLEQTHVHAVYNHIAPHFSATRYKPWPVVDQFLKSRDPGSIGADVGCGNGKYLGVNPSCFTLGSDRSDQLIHICHTRGFEAMVADNLLLPYRTSCFDFVISIAVIHHMSSPERRRAAIRELLRVTKPGGQVLIFVWAFEQEGKHKYDKQDVFVPWKMSKKVYTQPPPSSSPSTAPSDIKDDTPTSQEGEAVVYQRYYHMFTSKELDGLVLDTGLATIEDAGYDRDNWYVIARRNDVVA